MATFKVKNKFEDRVLNSKKIREKYPDRIPVIVERVRNSDIPDIDRNKFLVPHDLTFGQFFYIIRKRISIPPEKAIFCFVDSSFLPPISSTMINIYKDHADPDGFLYIQYSGESTFG